MDVPSIYAARSLPRLSLSPEILDIISKLKISFKPVFRKPFVRRRHVEEVGNWRESVLVDVVRKVREKDDPDYDEINASINKMAKSSYGKLITDIIERLKKRDEMFRLRVTTLLFDRGIRQNFYASILADAYSEIAKNMPDALQDLQTQIAMFDTLYDTANVTVIPSSTDAGYDDAVIAWTKQKEMKRGYAVFIAELYVRSLIPEETMMGFLRTVMDDLKESIRMPKNPALEEHVDALVRFLFAVSTKLPIANELKAVLAIPRADVPSLTMKNRFKLEDAVKVSK
jgi:hypothetical protein